MKIFSVTFFCFLTIFNIINSTLGMPHISNITLADEDTAVESIYSVLPLKVILEEQLQLLKASKRSNSLLAKLEVSDKNVKLVAKMSNSSTKNICSETELRKKVSAEEISKIFSGDIKFEEDETSLQKIYESVKDCQFVKVRRTKLWGPLWHCINRLFLFFVFG